MLSPAAVHAAAVVGDREHDVAVPPRTARSRRAARRARARSRSSSLKTSASAVARWPASDDRLELGGHLLARDETLDEHRPQPVEQLGEIDVVLAVLRQHLVHRGDREDPVDRVPERLARIDVLGARACSRSSDATVCRLFLTRWWISWASTPRSAMRPCSSATAAWWAIACSSSRSSSVNGVSRSQTSSPIWRPRPAQRQCAPRGRRHGPRARRSGRPRARARRRSRRSDVDRRRDDRLERLLEVERLGDRLRDPRQRLELVHAALCGLVELRVLDRLRHLGGDRHEQLDLGLGERRAARGCARSARPRACRARGSGRRGSTRTRPRAGWGRA